jgi:hypothetical protein
MEAAMERIEFGIRGLEAAARGLKSNTFFLPEDIGRKSLFSKVRIHPHISRTGKCRVDK